MNTPPRHTITPAELEAAARASYEFFAAQPCVIAGPWPDWDNLDPAVHVDNVDAIRAGLSAIGIEVAQ